MKTITIKLTDLLELLVDSMDYQYGKPEFYDSIFKIIGRKLTEKDIYDFSNNTFELESDIDDTIELLTELNKKYGIDPNIEELAIEIEEEFNKEENNEIPIKQKNNE